MQTQQSSQQPLLPSITTLTLNQHTSQNGLLPTVLYNTSNYPLIPSVTTTPLIQNGSQRPLLPRFSTTKLNQ